MGANGVLIRTVRVRDTVPVGSLKAPIATKSISADFN